MEVREALGAWLLHFNGGLDVLREILMVFGADLPPCKNAGPLIGTGAMGRWRSTEGSA